MKYFKNSEEAVRIIKSLLQDKDWQSLSEYYHLDNSDFIKEQTIDYKFYLRDSIPEAHHPTDNPIYIRPFDPSYNYNYSEDYGDSITVWLIKEIDQGGGQVQIGTQTFKLYKTEKGLQILP